MQSRAIYRDPIDCVEWLNATKGTAARSRALAVRQELEELGVMLDDLKRRRRESKTQSPRRKEEILKSMEAMKELAGLQEAHRVRHNALNQMLRRYIFVPVLAYHLDTGFWRFGTIPAKSKGPEINIEGETGYLLVNEAAAVSAFARLAGERRLWCVRLCEQCGDRWMVALRKVDRFCSDQCRTSFHQSTPEYVLKHRESVKRHKLSPGYKKAAK